MLGSNYVGQSDVQLYDPFDDQAVFEYKYSLRPRRCYTTGQLIFGLAVRGRRIITGSEEAVIEDRWYHRHPSLS